MGIDSRVQASGQKKSILVCLTQKEPWMKSPVASVVPWPQPSHHHVWTSVSSAKGEDWTKWTQVGLSGSKRHCPSGQKNPWCHFSSPAVPWRGSRGSGRLLSQSHYQSGLQASWRWAHTSMLRPGPPLPQLCLSSSHALSPGLTRLP